MKVPYYCPYCNERSTRQWNLEIHIKRKHGGSPGQYLASDPFYKRSVQSDQFGSATIADSVRSFQPIIMSQQTPPWISHYSADPTYQPWHVRDESSLSQDTLVKIEEFKRMINKYSHYHENPDDIIRLTIYNSINGDNTYHQLPVHGNHLHSIVS